MNSCARAATASCFRPTNWPMPWSTWTTRSPTLRSRKSEKKVRRVRPMVRRRPTRVAPHALLVEDVGLGEDRQAGVGRGASRAISAPVATSTTAARVTSAASIGSASTSYSRSSSIVRSARPGDSATNSTVSPASRARRRSATQSVDAAVVAGCTLWQVIDRTGRSATSTASCSRRIALASTVVELGPGTAIAAGSGTGGRAAAPRRGSRRATRRAPRQLLEIHVLDDEEPRPGVRRVVEHGAVTIEHLRPAVARFRRARPDREHVAQRHDLHLIDRLDRALRSGRRSGGSSRSCRR